jgi:dTMP kinase
MRLIIIDGLDGVGKDTQAGLIRKRYEQVSENVVIRSHPEMDNFFGKKAKHSLLGKGKINRLKASFFYMMDVLRSIRKYYGRGDIDTLIMVRYLVGTAYLPGRLANIGYGFFVKFVPTSRYMFFLDASPGIMLRRVERRKDKEMFETLDKLIDVRKKALELVKRWYIIDASGSVRDTFEKIEKILDKLDG